MCAAIVSWAAVDQASARGPGSFGGGSAGVRFGHAPSLGARVSGGGDSARAPFHPAQVATGAQVTAGMRFAFHHPQELPQAGGPTGYAVWHRPADGRSVPGTIDNPSAPGIAAIIAAHRTAQSSQVGQSTGVPNVVATGTVFGHEQQGPTQSIPGIGTSTGGVWQLNTPGSQYGQQQGPRSIPGIDATGGAAGLNTSAPVNSQDGADAAMNAIAKLAGQANPISQVTQGGVNGLNTPVSAGAGIAEEDGTGKTNTTGSGGGSKSGGKGTGGSPGGTSGTNGGGSASGTNNGSANGGGTSTAGSSSGGKDSGKTNVSGPPDKSNVGSQPNGLNFGYGTEGWQPDGSFQGSANTYKDKNGNTITEVTSVDKNGTVSQLIVGPITIGKKGGMPGDEDTSSTASTAGGPAPNSTIAKKNYGGGTGNNSETTGGAAGGLATGSAYAKRSHGDGNGNDAGDNNRIGKGGTLATGSVLTQKDQGDGGGSDTRGGGGGTSVITGATRIGNPGGGHNQLSGSFAKTN